MTGAGDFLLVTPDRTVRLTAALLTERDIAKLPRVETPGCLDLAGYEDIERVIDAASIGRADPVEPEHVALALASERGITWLASELGVGATKARCIKDFADRVRVKLLELGYTTIPAYQQGQETALEVLE